MSIRINVCNGYNERYPPDGAKKAYLCRITGCDSKLTFAREFKDDVYIIDPGLYEHRQTDNKGLADDSYILVLDCSTFPTANGDTLRTFAATRENAIKIAKAMDDGQPIDAIVVVVDASSRIRRERTWEFRAPAAQKSVQNPIALACPRTRPDAPSRP